MHRLRVKTDLVMTIQRHLGLSTLPRIGCPAVLASERFAHWDPDQLEAGSEALAAASGAAL